LTEVTDSTVNRALAGLRRLFHFAMSKEYLEESPFPKDPKSGLFHSEKGIRGKKRYYTEDEVMKILAALPEDPWYLRAMVITAYLSGMRAGELLNLKRATGVNLETGEISLAMTKAGEPQGLKMQDELVELFREWMEKHPQGEYVFCKDDGNPLARDDYYKPFKRALAAIGKNGKGWNFHTLRHTTGTQLHLKGADPIAIKDQLRHSDIRITTDFYVGNNSAYQKAQIEKLSNGCFKEFLGGIKANSETVKNTLKKEAIFGIPQEVPPIASA
jgi:integrase